MALIDALRTVWRHRYTYDVLTAEQVSEAYEQIRQTVDAYDALQPDWSDAPEWAQWYALNVNGGSWWFENEPWLEPKMDGVWVQDGGLAPGHLIMKLPLGIDWRECIWRRPEQEAGDVC